MNRMTAAMSLFSVLLFVFMLPPAQGAENLHDALRERLDALQKSSPGGSQERALQAEIIELVRKMRETPPLPQEVRRHMARGEAFLELAKDKSGFDLAIGEFRQAARLAPWLPQTHYNLGIVQEKAGRYDEAMISFKLYLMADPKAEDAQAVQGRIYKIEAQKEIAKKQEADKQRQEQARLEEERNRQKAREEDKRRQELASYQRLSGKWCLEPTRAWCADIKISGSEFYLVSGWRMNFGNNIPWQWWDIYKGAILPGGILDGLFEQQFYSGDDCREKFVKFTSPLRGSITDCGRKITFQSRTYTSRYYDFRTCSGWYKGETELGFNLVR